MDIRHPMKAFDEQMVAWCAEVNMPLHILLTKSDKLKRAAATESLRKVQQMLARYQFEHSVQTFSSLKKTGLDEAIAVLNRWLQLDAE
jgi:GTP-binding protein